MEIPSGPSIAGPHTNEQQQGNLVQDYERRFEPLSIDKYVTESMQTKEEHRALGRLVAKDHQ